MAVALAAVSALPAVSAAQGSFHLVFGVTGSSDGRDADAATAIVHTAGGDLVVAGSGASYASDDGRRNTHPLLARVGSDGVLRWQRIYDALENRDVIALGARGEEQFALLRKESLVRDSRSDAVNLVTEVTLHRIDDRGNASDALATLRDLGSAEAVPVIADQELTQFLLFARGAPTGVSRPAAQVFRVDLRGRVTAWSVTGALGNAQWPQQVGADEFVFAQQHQGPEHAPGSVGPHTDLVRLHATGELEVVATVAEGLCYSVAASRNGMVCARAPLLRSDRSSDVIVAFSAAGQERWRRDLEPGVTVERMRLLDSGDLIYADRRAKHPAVSRLDPSGRLLWSRTMSSAGEYVFLADIDALDDGRLAFLGSTGPWNGFTSTDTSALLLVTGAPERDLGSLEPISNIIDVSRDAGRR